MQKVFAAQGYLENERGHSIKKDYLVSGACPIMMLSAVGKQDFDGVAFGIEFLDVKIIFDLVVHA